MLRIDYEGLFIGLFFMFVVSGCQQSSLPHASDPPAPDIELTAAGLSWIGDQIFRNECSGKKTCLVHWNEGEAFPSLGIGHFIWYPASVEGPFVESFPALVRYMSQQNAPLPGWLTELDPFDAPWPNRAAFMVLSDSDQIAGLRAWLDTTRDLQAGFIVRRARNSLSRVMTAVPESEKSQVRKHLEALLSTPGGVYAVIDYVNFKGEGLSDTERYRGQGWGLLQVLRAMEKDGTPAVVQFRLAAARMLTQRASNADKPIERERWLPGWLKRLQTYRDPDEDGPAPK